jgi:alanyl-tRNA synthetase
VALDQTVFYPASGGQPPDRGTINGTPVADVREDDGDIWHVLQGPVMEAGARVTAAIDWDRRFDHMQQHTGQHILSAAFLRALGAQTLSVHMDRSCTLDLAVPAIDPDGLARVERMANTVVMENRPVTIRDVDDDEAAALDLRRPPRQTGLIRVVEVADFDRSACGGTHVRATAEVGPILIRGWERYKAGARVEFLCGWRALQDYRRTRALMRDVTGRLTTGEDDATDAIGRLQERARRLERDLEAARRALLGHEAASLVAAAAPRGAAATRVVVRTFAGRSMEDLRALAQAITALPDAVAILASDPGRRLIVARGRGLALDASDVLRATLAPHDGRGGGRADVAEGAAPAAPSVEHLADAAHSAALARLVP